LDIEGSDKMTIERSPQRERSLHIIFENGDRRIDGELRIGRGDNNEGARFSVLFS
jgi:hypothetical protein